MTLATERPRAGAWLTIRRGLRLSPELRRGLPGTLVLALIATAGRVIVPIAIQQVIDGGIRSARRPPDPDDARFAGLLEGQLGRGREGDARPLSEASLARGSVDGHANPSRDEAENVGVLKRRPTP